MEIDSADIYSEDDESYDDFEITEDTEDLLLTADFDESAKKEIKKEADSEENIEKEIEDDNDPDEKDKPVTLLTRRNYKMYPYLTLPEYTSLFGEVADILDNSRVIIPEKFHELLKVKSGNSIIIAAQWIEHCKTYPLPNLTISRKINGRTFFVKPEDLINVFYLNDNGEFSTKNDYFYNNFNST